MDDWDCYLEKSPRELHPFWDFLPPIFFWFLWHFCKYIVYLLDSWLPRGQNTDIFTIWCWWYIFYALCYNHLTTKIMPPTSFSALFPSFSACEEIKKLFTRRQKGIVIDINFWNSHSYFTIVTVTIMTIIIKYKFMIFSLLKSV